MAAYLRRWLALGGSSWLYLTHAALVTGSLAVTSLLFNLAVLALGHPRSFLGLLTVAGVATAAALSLPLWWLAARVGPRRALLASAALQACGALTLALWPAQVPLLLAAGLTGVAAVLFQVSAAPFMMRHSDDATRDHLFSANAAVNLGVAGAGSLLAGQLPSLCARLLGAGAESPAAYRASFAVAGAGLVLALVPLLFVKAEGQTLNAKEGAVEAPVPTITTPIPQPSPTVSDSAAPARQTFSVYRFAFIVPLLLPPALISVGAALLMPYLNLFFKERFGLQDQALGGLFAAVGLATGAAVLAGPLLSGRVGKAGAIVITQALSIPLLLAVGFAPALGVAAFAAVARGALFNISAPLYDALAMERTAPHLRPAVIGLVNAAYASGYLVAPAVSVAVQERWGFAPLFVATAACYALAAAAIGWFFWRGDGPAPLEGATAPAPARRTPP